MKINVIVYFAILLFTLAASKADHKPYILEIPNTNEKLSFAAIQGGKFLIGSPVDETNRRNDEGPQKEISISPFWMSIYEITWDSYLIFQNKELETTLNSPRVDAVARPTKPYVEMSFGQGKNGGFPVCNVTQYAARAYCKWLFEKTGIFYRLPTEAEWEYAARAGSQTSYYFGQNESDLKNHAWYYENSDGAYKKVGQKLPNAWGLYDMYGNVAEWTSDTYLENKYDTFSDDTIDPILVENKLYPHTIKGGHWDDDPDMCRSAARRPSTPRLKQRDPQIPRSKWWLTDAPFLGFRIVRPMQKPTNIEIQKYYSLPVEDI